MSFFNCACAALLLLASPAIPAYAGAVEAGVSHDLAISRAERLSRVQYALDFELRSQASTVAGQETLSFSDRGTGDLALDYREGDISAATLNGKSISTQLVQGHLVLPAPALKHGRNRLNLSFKSHVAAAGRAFTRYEDRDDHNEYIYTLFVPMDASTAFPCFDQPDVKAPLRF